MENEKLPNPMVGYKEVFDSIKSIDGKQVLFIAVAQSIFSESLKFSDAERIIQMKYLIMCFNTSVFEPKRYPPKSEIK